MRILISNDDGIFAPGILALTERLAQDHEVLVVAPKEEQSGRSHAITLYKSVALRQVEMADLDVEAYSLDGTPADCVRVGIDYILGGNVDLVVAGINRGLNIGSDVPYSGTVSAAMEALHYGKPAIAVSAQIARGFSNFPASAEAAAYMIGNLTEDFFADPFVLNINVPAVPDEEMKGWQTLANATRVSDRYRKVGKAGDTSFLQIYNRYPTECPAGSDLDYIRKGFITVSPLSSVCKTEEHLLQIENWLSK